MSTTSDKRQPRPKTTARADQLRPLNLPQPVTVELDDSGLPLVVSDCCVSAPLHLCTSAPDKERVEATEGNVARNAAGAELQPPYPNTDPAQRCRSLAVESVLESWHVDDEWWREPISRRYLEVILEGGKHVVLYEDFTTGDWFMQMP